MSAESLVQVVLMAFVLLAPMLVVAVLASGLSRREHVEADATPRRLPSPNAVPSAAPTAASRSAA